MIQTNMVIKRYFLNGTPCNHVTYLERVYFYGHSNIGFGGVKININGDGGSGILEQVIFYKNLLLDL